MHSRSRACRCDRGAFHGLDESALVQVHAELVGISSTCIGWGGAGRLRGTKSDFPPPITALYIPHLLPRRHQAPNAERGRVARGDGRSEPARHVAARTPHSSSSRPRWCVAHGRHRPDGDQWHSLRCVGCRGHARAQQDGCVPEGVGCPRGEPLRRRAHGRRTRQAECVRARRGERRAAAPLRAHCDCRCAHAPRL